MKLNWTILFPHLALSVQPCRISSGLVAVRANTDVCLSHGVVIKNQRQHGARLANRRWNSNSLPRTLQCLPASSVEHNPHCRGVEQMLCELLNTRLLTGSHCLCSRSPRLKGGSFFFFPSVETFMFHLRPCTEVTAKRQELAVKFSSGSEQTFTSTFRVHCPSLMRMDLYDGYVGACGITSKKEKKISSNLLQHWNHICLADVKYRFIGSCSDFHCHFSWLILKCHWL